MSFFPAGSIRAACFVQALGTGTCGCCTSYIYATNPLQAGTFQQETYSTQLLKTELHFKTEQFHGRKPFTKAVRSTDSKNQRAFLPLVELQLIIFSFSQIVEATLLIASYINYRATPSLLSSTQPSRSRTPAKKPWETENRCFLPSVPRSTKGPTLL